MNLYFAASIRAGRELQPVYTALVRHLVQGGHTVLTEHVASQNVEADEGDMTDQEIYTQDVAFLDRSDAVVAEVTVPSLGVGYEIAYALHVRRAPVLCLCRAGTPLSAMLTGNTHPGLTLAFYQDTAGALAAVDRFTRSLS